MDSDTANGCWPGIGGDHAVADRLRGRPAAAAPAGKGTPSPGSPARWRCGSSTTGRPAWRPPGGTSSTT